MTSAVSRRGRVRGHCSRRGALGRWYARRTVTTGPVALTVDARDAVIDDQVDVKPGRQPPASRRPGAGPGPPFRSTVSAPADGRRLGTEHGERCRCAGRPAAAVAGGPVPRWPSAHLRWCRKGFGTRRTELARRTVCSHCGRRSAPRRTVRTSSVVPRGAWRTADGARPEDRLPPLWPADRSPAHGPRRSGGAFGGVERRDDGAPSARIDRIAARGKEHRERTTTWSGSGTGGAHSERSGRSGTDGSPGRAGVAGRGAIAHSPGVRRRPCGRFT